ncbi:hypothetical protein CHARACLAT_031414, partial [Characodon lateralis]|nr:hypothetical protein [Characodon lateralis]
WGSKIKNLRENRINRKPNNSWKKGTEKRQKRRLPENVLSSRLPWTEQNELPVMPRCVRMRRLPSRTFYRLNRQTRRQGRRRYSERGALFQGYSFDFPMVHPLPTSFHRRPDCRRLGTLLL